MTKGYLTTREVCERYSIGRTTLYRWMQRKSSPFPAPAISGNAGQNRWRIEDIENYEARIAA
ncbi:helix-turn-helix transcriptional regulator [Vreelandella sp. 21]|uniref:helix-turn-helix transcriptional regulator n=1 Tax=Vreelandella sp. 21 TaxID=3402864 RepID=UPI003D9A75B4